MSLWLKMLEQRENHREERRILIKAMTLGESNLLAVFLAKSNQLEWYAVPMRSSPLLFKVQGILQILDQDGS